MKAILRALAICMVASAAACLAQDSLGDVARQQRWAKPSTPAPHEITNDDIASSAIAAKSASPDAKNPGEGEKDSANKEAPNAAEVREKIRAQKQKVKTLEDKIAADQKQLAKHDTVGSVTVYERVTDQGTGMQSLGVGVCQLPDYVQEQRGFKDWCDEPDKLQGDIDATQKQLDSERSILASMQEEARQQGFGNSIYDPD